MGSFGNQNPWGPYVTYKDCSQEICSIYCPQWCYIIFPPPPPLALGDDGSGTDFSPLIIAVIGILASAFILVSYYTFISKYCRRRNQVDNTLELNENHNQVTSETWQGTTRGLDESIIKSITMCKYKKGEGLIEETDCSVCLSEFQENESLRLLPKCNHAFHLPCIDTWLKSHASCPLCRANVVPINVSLPPQATNTPPTQEASQNITTNVSTTDQYQNRINETVLVVQDLEEVVINLAVGDGIQKNPSNQDLYGVQNMADQIPPIKRSASLNSCSSSTNVPVSIADILKISEDHEDEDYQLIQDTERGKVGVLSNLVKNHLAMKRSISTGRLMMPTRSEREGNSVIPN